MGASVSEGLLSARTQKRLSSSEFAQYDAKAPLRQRYPRFLLSPKNRFFGGPKRTVFRKSAAKVLLFFDMCKFFCIFLQKNCLYRDFALIFSFLAPCFSFLSARRDVLSSFAAGRSLPLLWGQPFLRARR